MSLVSMEAFDVAGLAVARGAVALAADTSTNIRERRSSGGGGGSTDVTPGQLAVAVKVSKVKTRLLLLDVLPGNMLAGGQPAQVVHQVRAA